MKRANEYYNNSDVKLKNSKRPSMFNKIKTIWEELLPDRELIIETGKMDIQSKGERYNFRNTSDGERMIFYLISRIMCAPSDHIIIIDEPEMCIHKAILPKLWDTLENYRRDCMFIYLTHDLDFAGSRRNSALFYLNQARDQAEGIGTHVRKLFTVPEVSNIPKEILLQIVGSRKHILFVEGDLDQKLFSIIYNEFTVIKMGSCGEVIKATKAFNKLEEHHFFKVYGIIDRDYRSDNDCNDLKKE